MTTAFVALAVAYAALAGSVRPYVAGRAGKIGVGCMYVASVGLAIAAAFATDPITTPKADATVQGQIHTLGGTLGLAMPVAAALIGWRLVKHPQWRTWRTLIVTATVIAVVAFVAAAGTIASLANSNDGTFGPDVPVGWPNRIEMAANCVWLIVIATGAKRVERYRLHDIPAAERNPIDSYV